MTKHSVRVLRPYLQVCISVQESTACPVGTEFRQPVVEGRKDRRKEDGGKKERRKKGRKMKEDEGGKEGEGKKEGGKEGRKMKEDEKREER